MATIFHFIRKKFRWGANAPDNCCCKEADRPVSSFTELPVELVLIVGTMLSPEDMLAFSLCCKSLFNIFRLPETLNRQQKQNLLERLERDVGDKYSFCPHCIALHHFTTDSRAQVFRSYRRLNCHAGIFTPLYSWTRGDRILDYQVARLLANNHRLGSPTGISPMDFYRNDQSLSRFYTDHSPSLPRWHVTMEIKFINNQLLLKATHQIQGKDWNEVVRGDSVRVGHQLWTHVCVFEGGRPTSFFDGGGAIAFSCLRPLPPYTTAIQTTNGCKSCLSDWTIDWSICGAERVTVTAQTYHLMGDISSHNDPAWLLITGCDWAVPRNQASTIWRRYKRGTTMDLWEGADSSPTLVQLQNELAREKRIFGREILHRSRI